MIHSYLLDLLEGSNFSKLAGKGQWDGQGQLELESKRFTTKTFQSQTKPEGEIARYHLVGQGPSLWKFSPCLQLFGEAAHSLHPSPG